ncbi:hypothetical protein CS022_19275 [Veronia nyctiphanis]|uniref:Uncharacterized protein n=1 Tax=Veronia nyctiphanis TaxID=1278244 RepID=A0A4V1LSJ3_9GAMM|nr:hypothetical protein [Veronia nyctiphanis]RXJ71898.1 hypothetical protein CS022_19275 [Veronia nyctiphanis]
MPQQVNASLLQLYFRESETAAFIDHTDLPALSDQDMPGFFGWMASKRHFQSEDVSGQSYIKTCSAGYVTEITFNADGTLAEFTLFNRFPTKGQWRIEQGALEIEIEKGSNRYHARVIANKYSNIHSAIEYKNGGLHAYLKLAQVKPVDEPQL